MMIEFNFENFFNNYYIKNDFENTSLDAAKYALQAGGKRFRFLLSMTTAKCFENHEDDNARRLAVAVELIHNYSLVHDDLPCMDDADERRGLPSCQKKFGEAQAVLAGDGLLNCAAEILFDGRASENYLKASKYLFEAAGFWGMVGGQSIDVKNSKLTFDEYNTLALLKTSKLICASVIPQAIYAKRNEKEISLLENFCNLLGLIYQFVDDLFDKIEDEFKPSILTFFDNNDAKKYICELSIKANEILSELKNCSSYNYNYLKNYLHTVINRMG